MKRFFLIVILLTNACFAADDFNAVVKAIEKNYGIRRQHIPLMGVMTKFSPDHEARSMKLAIFESEPTKGDWSDLQEIFAANLGHEWTPFIRVWSPRDHESVVIYAKPSDKGMRLMVACLDSEDSVVLSVDVDEKSLRDWIDDPEQMVHRSVNARDDER